MIQLPLAEVRHNSIYKNIYQKYKTRKRRIILSSSNKLKEPRSCLYSGRQLASYSVHFTLTSSNMTAAMNRGIIIRIYLYIFMSSRNEPQRGVISSFDKGV